MIEYDVVDAFRGKHNNGSISVRRIVNFDFLYACERVSFTVSLFDEHNKMTFFRWFDSEQELRQWIDLQKVKEVKREKR